MPNLGNSHHWRKNQTATTITNTKRPFIFDLLGSPLSVVCVGPSPDYDDTIIPVQYFVIDPNQ